MWSRGKTTIAIGTLFLLASLAYAAPDPFLEARRRMVEEQIKARGITDPRVLQAMLKVPRHLFVDRKYWPEAYNDYPLPIGYGQTISQPYIVALMTENLALRPGDRVLEIGTGSGYQAAILAELTDKVYTIEIIPPLAQAAQKRLQQLGYTQVQVKIGDGYLGWPEHQPFDAIIVTAAPDHVPPPLIRQLKEKGRMVIPVGPPGLVQTLWKISKVRGELQFTNLGQVLFVPLVRQWRGK
ncbi:MAG: protein-L-isoaspartate(D-aspartate) O-methyltransferase [Armatimonadota bacterium]|nr:protein-L-isoaspartate(D-aspartate) O-methyltransferase [Armatimonadota bacterium]